MENPYALSNLDVCSCAGNRAAAVLRRVGGYNLDVFRNQNERPYTRDGSVNLAQHLKDGAIDQVKLKKTVRTAMRMLDNVIDINYYAVKKARDSNYRHRPVGLGGARAGTRGTRA